MNICHRSKHMNVCVCVSLCRPAVWMILHDFSLTCFQGKLLITFHLFHRMLCVDYANRNIWLPVLREWTTPDDIVGLIYRKLNLLHKINCFVKISFRIKTADGHLEVLPPDLTLRKTKLIQLATLSKGGGARPFETKTALIQSPSTPSTPFNSTGPLQFLE